jgi:hypothetical protein
MNPARQPAATAKRLKKLVFLLAAVDAPAGKTV